MAEPQSLFEKIWSSHVVHDYGDRYALLHIDRDIMHDLIGGFVFKPMDEDGRPLPHPELAFATMDHGIETAPGRTDETRIPGGEDGVKALRRKSKEYGVRLFDLGDVRQGIVHVVTPELGIALPGSTLVCCDSHTCTVGGIGALTWGIGASEFQHVLATQTLVMEKPRTMRVTFNGAIPAGVTPKDMILHVIGHVGAKAGNGYAVEYAGEAVRSLAVEGR